MRLFVALRPSPGAVDHLRAQRTRWPTAPERWHVTLAFLGEQPGPEAVHDELAARLPGVSPLELALAGSGSFGADGPVWTGVAGDLDGLHALAATVAAAARASGIELEPRPYRPHLTVGRGGHPAPAELVGYRGPGWRAEEVELVRSDLGRTAVHTVLERYRLGQPRG